MVPVLQLKSYFFPKCKVEANPKYKPRDAERIPAPKVTPRTLVNKKDPLDYQITLEICSEPGGPYDYEISAVGFFRADENYPEEKRHRVVVINACSMLYTASREFLAAVTGRGPWGAVILPVTSFAPDSVNSSKGRKRKSTGAKG